MRAPPHDTTPDVRAEFVVLDLVSSVDCEPALRAVLAGPSGRWWSSRELSDTCEGYRRACERWAPEATEVSVTWLHHPDGGEDACLVIGYRALRSTTAFYDRKRLLRDRSHADVVTAPGR